VAVFAYHRETKIPVWQSGISVATSNARDTFILGVGPVQDGTIYHGTHFAGSRMQIPLLTGKQQDPPTRGLVSYYDEVQFDKITGQFGIPKNPTPEELNGQIESIVKVPKLSPLTEQMFAAMSPPAKPEPAANAATAPAQSPPGPPAAPAEPAPPGSPGPAASVAERPKPLPPVSPVPAPTAPPPAGAAAPPPAGAAAPPPAGAAAPPPAGAAAPPPADAAEPAEPSPPILR